MVRTAEEIKEFVKIMNPLKKKYKTKVKLGIMVETPSSVLLLDKLPKEIRFVSVGTNDLLQYFFAVDRIHPTLKADPLHPLFVEYLGEIVKKVKRQGRSLSLCGEMASDARVLPILLGLGFRDLSVSVSRISEVAKALGKVTIPGAKERTNKIFLRSGKSK